VAGRAVPVCISGWEVGDLGCGVRSDRVQPGLRPQGPEAGAGSRVVRLWTPKPRKYDAKVAVGLALPPGHNRGLTQRLTPPLSSSRRPIADAVPLAGVGAQVAALGGCRGLGW